MPSAALGCDRWGRLAYRAARLYAPQRHRARPKSERTSDSFPLGLASLDGPSITAGGVVFYNRTLDNYLRAYDVATRRKLWQSRLPAGCQATPMTYRIHDKRLVVVAAGGHESFGTTPGDAVLANDLK